MGGRTKNSRHSSNSKRKRKTYRRKSYQCRGFTSDQSLSISNLDSKNGIHQWVSKNKINLSLHRIVTCLKYKFIEHFIHFKYATGKAVSCTISAGLRALMYRRSPNLASFVRIIIYCGIDVLPVFDHVLRPPSTHTISKGQSCPGWRVGTKLRGPSTADANVMVPNCLWFQMETCCAGFPTGHCWSDVENIGITEDHSENIRNVRRPN